MADVSDSDPAAVGPDPSPVTPAAPNPAPVSSDSTLADPGTPVAPGGPAAPSGEPAATAADAPTGGVLRRLLNSPAPRPPAAGQQPATDAEGAKAGPPTPRPGLVATLRRIPPRRAAIIGVTTLVVLGVLWMVVTALIARRDLTRARADIAPLRTALANGEYATARHLAADLASKAKAAHSLTTGPAWWTVSVIPFLGQPVDCVRVIAAQADHLGRSVVPNVVSLATANAPTALQNGKGLDLAPLVSAEPGLAAAARTAQAATNTIGSTDGGWFAPVSSARRQALRSFGSLSNQLADVSRTVQTALPMLGETTPQRYFVAFENEAEMRGLGGVPGAFVIVEADKGTLTFTHYGNDLELLKTHVTVPLGADFDAMYGTAAPGYSYPNSDISPQFSNAARIWAAMWQAKSGQHINGAIALDPTALSYLMRPGGSATLADGTVVTPSTVVELAEKTQYEKFTTDRQRRDFLTGLAKILADRLVHARNPNGLLHAIGRSVSERRLVVWSEDQALESNIVAANWGGTLPPADGRPVSGFTITNETGGKQDYYLHRAFTYRRVGCGTGSISTSTMSIVDEAPSSGLPPYVTLREDTAPKDAKPGDDRLELIFYGGQAAQLQSVTLDGQSIQVTPGTEGGLLTVRLDLELKIGVKRRMTVVLKEGPSRAPVAFVRQPGVNPLTVQATNTSC